MLNRIDVQNDPVNAVDPSGLCGPLLSVVNFFLMHEYDISKTIEYLIDTYGGTNPSTLLAVLNEYGPNLTDALLQANQTLGQSIVGSLDYLAMQAGHDIINRGIPFVLDSTVEIANGLKNEWIRQNMPPPEVKKETWAQGPTK